MPFSITQTTNLRLTAGTNSIFLSILISVYICGLYPLTTSSSRTVDPVFGSVFLKFPVPGFLERDIKEAVHMMERNMISRAAFRRHMLRVCNREFEIPFQTGLAHSMATFQFGGFGGRDVIA